MSEYINQIRDAVLVAQVLSPTTYSWLGVRSPELPASIKRVLAPAAARGYLLYNLQWQLYRDFYCHGGVQPPDPSSGGSLQVGITPFVERLCAANAGRGYLEEGWTAISEEDVGRAVAASRAGLTLVISPQERESFAGEEVVAPGAQISLRFPKDLPGVSPGFYTALGDRRPGTGDIVRLYWHLNPEGAVRLMRLVTARFNEAALAFNLKVVSDPQRYGRCDAAVLYIQRSEFSAAAVVLGTIYPQLETELSGSVPALTLRLAPGLGLAEDPGHGVSFGMHHCALIAEGLVRAREAGKNGLDDRLSTVLATLTEAGVRVDWPYLRPGSSGEYDFRVAPSRATAGIDPTTRHTDTPDLDPLEVAAGIGHRLTCEAVWHAGMCNWVGATLREPGQQGKIYRALGPDLYGGTAGVALFLARLHALTGDQALRRTALGALNQALSRASMISPSERLGLYTGKPGIAIAAARVGIVFEEESLVRRALSLSFEIAPEPSMADYDLLSGSAGAIAGLLALRELPGAASLTSIAARLGDELIRVADKTEAGYSWKAPGQKFARNLTGLSHGAAGIAHALLELYGATREYRFREAAELAFDYERHCFDSTEGNWLDFRGSLSTAGRKGAGGSFSTPGRFATFWCHGAPGIALSRLRAYELLGDNRYLEEAGVALSTTHMWLRAALDSGTADCSLCHGLMGNAEVLLLGGHLRSQNAEEVRLMASEVAGSGWRRAEAQGGAWQCGTGGGEAPGLMLGLAGIGLYYLRLHDPHVESALLMNPLKAR